MEEEKRRREIEENRERKIDPLAIHMNNYRYNDNKDSSTRTQDYLDGKISPEVLYSDQFDLKRLITFDPCPFDNDDKYLDDPENREEICDLAKFAIDEHNKSIEQSGKMYVFEDVLSVRTSIGAVDVYTITFTAMEIDKTGGESKLRTIEAEVDDMEIEVYSLEYFKVMSDSDTEVEKDKITVQP